MFLTIIFITTVASIAVELIVAYKIPFWHHLAERFIVIALAMSFGLSYIMGRGFGASGLIIFVSALCSTIIAAPCYKGVAWYREAKKDGALGEDIASAIQLAKDLWTVIVFFIKVITWPVRSYRKIKEWSTSHTHIHQPTIQSTTRSNPST